MSALTVDAWQAHQLPPGFHQELIEWVKEVTPPRVANHVFHVAVYEGGCEFTYFLTNGDGVRYIANPEAPAGERYPAQSTWVVPGCPPPPEAAFRMAAALNRAARTVT